MDWHEVFDLAGVDFVDLQYGDNRQARAGAVARGARLHAPGIDPLLDLEGLAALIRALDRVITIDNSTAHLAGAVGTRAWVILPAAPDWRWMLQREDSPWYPCVRLFRRVRNEPGDVVMSQVAAALESWIEEDHGGVR